MVNSVHNFVSIIDGTSNSVIRNIPIAENEEGHWLSPSIPIPNTGFVISTNGHSISIIDGKTNNPYIIMCLH